MTNITAAALLGLGLTLHSLGQTHAILEAVGIVCAMAFFLLMYLQYPILFVGSARYPLARKSFPVIRWAIFGIYSVDLVTTLMGYLGGSPWTVSVHAYSLWAGVYLVTYSLAILTGPPKQRRRQKPLLRYRQLRYRHQWAGQWVPVPVGVLRAAR